jgi:hypothetical protein
METNDTPGKSVRHVIPVENRFQRILAEVVPSSFELKSNFSQLCRFIAASE